MWELCQIEVPQAGQTLILEIINEKIKEFCHRTEIYKKGDDLTIVSNTVSYTLVTEFTDIDGEMVKEIILKDSDGVIVNESQTLKFDIINGVITFYNYYGNPITGIPSEIATISFVYVAVPTNKTISDTLTEIDPQFHEYVRSGVMERLYRLYPTIEKRFQDGSTAIVKDIQMIQLSSSEFEKGIFRGTRFANSTSSIPKQIFSPQY
jgi:hypothetical protein